MHLLRPCPVSNRPDPETPTPGLPLISGQPDGRDDLHFATHHHFANLPAEDAAVLDVKGLITIAKEDYLAVPTPVSAVK